MDFVFIDGAIEHIIHLFFWGVLLSAVIAGSLKIAPSLQCWAALWKVGLLLCLLPLVPWGQWDFKFADIPVAHDLLPNLHAVWGEVGIASHPVNHDINASPQRVALFQLLALTALAVIVVSLVKTALFVKQLIAFNRSLSGYPRLDPDSEELSFVTDKQKANLSVKRISVVKSHRATSPFATGLRKPTIVLPQSFFTLSLRQQRLLMEHEITHINKGDLFWLMLSRLAQCGMWFNPVVHLIKPKLALAIELECDRQVLDTFPGMSRDYGSALINVVKHTQQNAYPQAAFFISQQFSDLKSRIKHSQEPMIKHGEYPVNKFALLTAVLVFSTTSWAINTNVKDVMTVEEFVQLHKHASRYIENTESLPVPEGNWVNPVKTSWVSSTFKAKQKFRNFRPHLGIDLAAELGDAIVAASNGVVIVADNTSINKNHGNVVIIDHGDQTLSMYSHMDSFDVKPGDVVSAGQLIGKVGSTGKSTGPHLHFEVITANHHVDPASIIEFTYK